MATPNEEILIEKWLSGEISESEKAELEQSGQLKELEAIMDETASWSLPPMDVNASFEKLQQKKAAKKETKVIPLFSRKSFLAIAASVTLLIGVFTYFMMQGPGKMVTVTTAVAENKTIQLDGCEITLNAASSISYDKENWADDKNVTLKGQALFKVVKGNDVKVSTKNGTVEALGTEFEVHGGDEYLIAKCYEGEIELTAAEGEGVTIEAGKEAKFFDGKIEVMHLKVKRPSWINGNSTFNEAPLVEVLDAMKAQYDIDFNVTKESLLTRPYTGEFVHDDLDTALKMVFDPLSIKYKIKGKTIKLK